MEEFTGALPGVDNTVNIEIARKTVNALQVDLDKATNKLFDSTEKMSDLWNETTGNANEAAAAVKGVVAETSKIPEKKALVVVPKLDDLATSETKWAISQAFLQGDTNRVKILLAIADAEVADAKKKMADAIPEKRDVTVKVLADGTSIETSKDMITKKFPDGELLLTNVGTKAHEASLLATQKKIDEVIPKEKLVEIQAKLDEAKLKGQADIIQKSIEWKAKLDIAQVESQTKIIESMFKSIDNTVSSTGTSLSSLFGTLAQMQGKGGTGLIEQQIIDENRRRDDALTLQKSLTEAQVANIKARTAKMDRGDSIITIDGKGLAPQLEAFMFAVLAAIKVRVNEEYADFLVGTK